MNIAGQPSGTALLEFAQTSDGSGGNQHLLLLLLLQEKCVEESTRRSYLWAVREKKSKEKQSEEQERPGLICESSSALSACWTKAAGEFDWRIRLVAFLWLLTSGGFGLRLESQWSNRHVCHFMEQSIDCGRGNNAFCFLFFAWREGCSCCGWSSCTCGCGLMFSTVAVVFWKLCWGMYVRFHMSSWKETSLLFFNFFFFTGLSLKSHQQSVFCLSPYWIY